MAHKVPYPDDCDIVLKEIKKKQISANVLIEKFKNNNFNRVIYDLGKTGAVSRVLVRENGEDMIHYLFRQNTKFSQGRNEFINRKDLGGR